MKSSQLVQAPTSLSLLCVGAAGGGVHQDWVSSKHRKGKCCVAQTICGVISVSWHTPPALAPGQLAASVALCWRCLNVVLWLSGWVFPHVICHPRCAALQVPLTTITPLSKRQQLIFYHWDFLPWLLYPPGVNKLLQVSSNYVKCSWTYCA